uniref:Uncharacterized protein n=1 Tax=Emiliania huxleyi TaxID=2903 RepID=A0A7S3WD79_EMIHU
MVQASRSRGPSTSTPQRRRLQVRSCLAVHLAAASGAGPKGLDRASKCGAAGRAERRQAAATWRSGQASASPAAADDAPATPCTSPDAAPASASFIVAGGSDSSASRRAKKFRSESKAASDVLPSVAMKAIISSVRRKSSLKTAASAESGSTDPSPASNPSTDAAHNGRGPPPPPVH